MIRITRETKTVTEKREIKVREAVNVTRTVMQNKAVTSSKIQMGR